MIDLKISLLICTHIDTDSKQLLKTFKSILTQDHIPNEIIVIQNGPLTNNSMNLIKTYAEINKKIKIIIIDKNLGLAMALNKAIKFSTNELIARIDPGDKVINNRFFHQKNFMDKNKNTIICGCFINEIYNKKVKLIKKPINNKIIIDSLKFKNPIIHSTVIFRKIPIEKIGSYPLINKCQDYYLWVKCSEFGFNFYNLPLPLVEVDLDLSMMKRRNFSYFLYEFEIYNYMYKRKIINPLNYLFLIIFRFTLRILPNFIKIKLYNFR